jgi:pre-mRNA-processing factor 17
MSALASLGAAYDEDSESAQEAADADVPEIEARAIMPLVHAAPDVDIAFEHEKRRAYPLIAPTQTSVQYNPKYEDLYAPEQGPIAPEQMRRSGKIGGRNHHLATVEKTNVHTYAFDDQYHTFSRLGYAADPAATHGASTIVGDALRFERAAASGHHSAFDLKAPLAGGKVRDEAAAVPRKRLRDGDPFAPFDFPLSRDDSEQLKLSAEDQAIVDERSKERAAAKARADGDAATPVEEKSIFHGESLTDYQGRTYMHPPAAVRSMSGEHECFIPRGMVHTYSGHTKGVSAIRWLPRTGHLLLSAGMDAKVKLWDVSGNRKCLRTFLGHNAAVRDVAFNNDGSRFLSCSYDRYIKLWDTETGQCLGAYTTKKLPYCVKFHPDEDKQNIFIAGQADKQAVQWDITTGEPVQFYNQHLGAVNSITFCDGGRRFATTSDDKKVLVWEYGIPVPIKHISEPHMHSIPYMALHPNEKWLLGQSMDNQIVVYGVHNRFRQHNKKLFKGHLNAGYACQVDVTPDGQFVLSGDSDGRVFFWDWKSTKVFRKLKCHDGVCIGASFHPLFPSTMATCGWDGTIKLWE